MSKAPQNNIRIGRFSLECEHALIMGVLNVTPDSFSDGGRFVSVDAAIDQAAQMIGEGAQIIDIGGESTRPGAADVSEEEELARVMPLLQAITERFAVPVSIDTSKPAVMREVIAAGAAMINDVRALREPGAIEVVAQSDVSVCLMHMQGEPRTMQAAPSYSDVCAQVTEFLLERAAAGVAAGITADRIVLDPGFGFGKRLPDNIDLLNGIMALASYGFPVLAGLSRKSMLAALTGREVDERLAGSIVLATLAAQNGASILRVHDVAQSVDAARIVAAISARVIE